MPNPSRALIDFAIGSPAWLKLPNWLLLVFMRWHVAWVFFAAGWLKAQSFDTTLSLFDSEYQVALLAPHTAAWLATGIELLLPPLLAVGLATRPVALVLLVFNCVAAVSYPDLSDAGAKDHVLWGVVLLLLGLQGGGALTLDRLLSLRLGARFTPGSSKDLATGPVCS